MINGECQLLVYNTQNAQYELFKITRSFTQPTVKSDILLWGVFDRNITGEELLKIELENNTGLCEWLFHYDEVF